MDNITIDDLELDVIKESNGIFETRGRKYHFTYAQELNKELLLEFFKNLSKTHIKEYSIVNEIGKTGHLHTHAYICWNNQVSFKTSKFADYNCPDNIIYHPNIKRVASELHRQRILKYHHKDGEPLTNVDEPNKTALQEYRIKTIVESDSFNSLLVNPEMSDWISSHLQYAEKLFYSTQHYEHDVGVFEEWRLDYHEYILDIINNDVDFRKIYWFYETTGNMCKTRFCKYLQNIEFYNVCLCTVSNFNDFAHNFRSFNNCKVVIFDIPRGETANFKDLRPILECLKNGYMNSNKYNSITLKYSPPHVIIFSNELPTHKCKLSADRLQTFRILSSGGIEQAIPLQNENYSIVDTDDE